MRSTFLTLIACYASANSQAHLKILSPKTLKEGFKNGEIAANIANFGRIPYGQTLVGSLVFDLVENKLSSACEEFDASYNSVENLRPRFFVATRGECSFVTKVRNMEESGFSLGIIVEDSDVDIDQIIMSDDGTGDGITIPSVLIGKSDWDTLIQGLLGLKEEDRTSVVFSASFSMAHPDNRAEYDIWYTSSDDRALDFISSMREYNEGLGADVLMTPRFVYWRCVDCDDEMIKKHCWSNGKYCAVDSANNKHTGQQIMLEDLREKCIAKKSQEKWWSYMWYIHSMCGTNIDEQCSKDGHEFADLNFKKTMDCVKNGFTNYNMLEDQSFYQENAMIDEDIELWKEYGTGKYPAVVINQVTFRGQIESTNVFEAICAGFKTMPRYCAQTLNKIRKNSGPYENMPDGIQPMTLVLIVVGLVFLNCTLVYCYRRYTKREMKKEMNQQIETAVSQYMRIDPSTVQ